MLMAWGPFVFTVPTYSVDALRRSVEPRAEAQPIIGTTPSIHRLGPGNETVTLTSTFFPQHLNGFGLEQLAGVRAAVNALRPLPLIHRDGRVPNVFGNWIATSISDDQEAIGATAVPGSVSVEMEMMQEGGVTSIARSIAMQAISGVRRIF